MGCVCGTVEKMSCVLHHGSNRVKFADISRNQFDPIIDPLNIGDVTPGAMIQRINYHHLCASLNQRVRQVTAYKPQAAGYDYALASEFPKYLIAQVNTPENDPGRNLWCCAAPP
jgi:hypothetical protein